MMRFWHQIACLFGDTGNLYAYVRNRSIRMVNMGKYYNVVRVLFILNPVQSTRLSVVRGA